MDDQASPVPFLDLGRESRALRRSLDAAWHRVVDRGIYLLGPELEAFEEEFAAYCGTTQAAGVASGLAALELILKAAGIGKGDQVIVPANTYIATWLAVSNVGATPVPVEPDPVTRNIDPHRVPEAVTTRTRAILTVHLYGLPFPMGPLRAIADRHGLALYVDAAQSAGTTIGGDRSLTLGDAAAFSFYPTKNLGALADAGAIVTQDSKLAAQIRLLRNYGMRDRSDHPLAGTNARMEELQAAILREKLPHLESWRNIRNEKAALYTRRLAGLPGIIQLPSVTGSESPCWHLYAIQVTSRDQLRDHLRSSGIDTSIHYPVPPHLSGVYRGSAFGPLPITEKLARTTLSLPFSPFHSDEELSRVCEAIESWTAPPHS